MPLKHVYARVVQLLPTFLINLLTLQLYYCRAQTLMYETYLPGTCVVDGLSTFEGNQSEFGCLGRHIRSLGRHIEPACLQQA